MSLTSPDFESGAYTNFATPASKGKDNKSRSWEIATGGELLETVSDSRSQGFLILTVSVLLARDRHDLPRPDGSSSEGFEWYPL